MKTKTKTAANTRTRTRWFIRRQDELGCEYSATGYSKFYQRLTKASNGGLRSTQVYGPKQCREHIAELRKHFYDGKYIYADSAFEIVREVTVETIIATSKPKSKRP